MLSESQERMLLLVRAGRESAVQQHFARWELHAAIIGQVKSEAVIRVREGDSLVAELPISLLTDDVPAYDLRVEPPSSNGHADLGVQSTPNRRAAARDPADALLDLLGSPNLRSRKFAFRQYDSTVQGDTVLGPGHAAAVVRVDGTRKGLAVTTDCNPRLTRLDPRRGAAQAVAEAARNLACVGAEPVAVTDCLNFGNPEKPSVAWQLTETVHGLAEACRALEVPIVSGNVSLYNEAAGRAIPPTPTVGMVGLLEDVGLTVPTGFRAGNAIILLGEPPASLGASEYLPESNVFPRFDLHAERRLGGLLRALARRRVLRSAQDVGDGGLAVALAECALLGDCGCVLRLDGKFSIEVQLFSEDQARAVVTCAAADRDAVVALAAEYRVPSQVVGETGGDRLLVNEVIDLSLERLRQAWEPEA
jgi:phosphoribosylformylglycinamidine synthase